MTNAPHPILRRPATCTHQLDLSLFERMGPSRRRRTAATQAVARAAAASPGGGVQGKGAEGLPADRYDARVLRRPLLGRSAIPAGVEEVLVGMLLPYNTKLRHLNDASIVGEAASFTRARLRPYELRWLAHGLAVTHSLLQLK